LTAETFSAEQQHSCCCVEATAAVLSVDFDAFLALERVFINRQFGQMGQNFQKLSITQIFWSYNDASASKWAFYVQQLLRTNRKTPSTFQKITGMSQTYPYKNGFNFGLGNILQISSIP
jgi:hypothetical protein